MRGGRNSIDDVITSRYSGVRVSPVIGLVSFISTSTPTALAAMSAARQKGLGRIP